MLKTLRRFQPALPWRRPWRSARAASFLHRRQHKLTPLLRLCTSRSFKPAIQRFIQLRQNTTSSASPPSDATKAAFKAPTVPSYDITFTCRPCGHRSTHRISHQGYHKGSVLITCPSCKARHVISDHLKMFGDKETDIETLMKEKGEKVRFSRATEDGDIEYYADDPGGDQAGGLKES